MSECPPPLLLRLGLLPFCRRTPQCLRRIPTSHLWLDRFEKKTESFLGSLLRGLYRQVSPASEILVAVAVGFSFFAPVLFPCVRRPRGSQSVPPLLFRMKPSQRGSPGNRSPGKGKGRTQGNRTKGGRKGREKIWGSFLKKRLGFPSPALLYCFCSSSPLFHSAVKKTGEKQDLGSFAECHFSVHACATAAPATSSPPRPDCLGLFFWPLCWLALSYDLWLSQREWRRVGSGGRKIHQVGVDKSSKVESKGKA